MNENTLDKRSRTVLFSISSNALLLVVKLLTGIFTGSVSVLSEAVHSATDLVASVVTFVAVRRSASPLRRAACSGSNCRRDPGCASIAASPPAMGSRPNSTR